MQRAAEWDTVDIFLLDEEESSGELRPEHYLLLSGGLDSATLAGWLLERHPAESVQAVTFLYGQKHVVEVEAAEAVARHYGLALQAVELPTIHGSALTEPGLRLPEGRDLSLSQGVAPSYVPARNLLFLAFLASLADLGGRSELWIAVHHDDYTGYPDCRPAFIDAADQAVRLGTQYGLRVRAPFVSWSKGDIVRYGLSRGVPYHLTHSCYQGRRPACGVCDTCQARLAAFKECAAADPLAYEPGPAAGEGGAGQP